MGPALRLDAADLEQLGRYTYRLARGAEGPARLVLATGERSAAAAERLRRSAALRRATDDPVVHRCFPPVAHEGPVTIGVVTSYGLLTQYLPGRDLTDLVRTRTPAACDDGPLSVARQTGVALRGLHSMEPAAVMAAEAVSTPAEWIRHIADWITELAGRLARCPGGVVVGSCSAGDLQPLLPHLATRVMDLLETVSVMRWTPQLIHNDAHGGNILVTVAGGSWRLSGIIDERLRAGDGPFDLAALMNWAYELCTDVEYGRFCAYLLEGYGSVLDSASAVARLALYQVERSLGRLAYYLPLPAAERVWFDPEHVRFLHRHLEILDRVTSGDPDRWSPVLMDS